MIYFVADIMYFAEPIKPSKKGLKQVVKSQCGVTFGSFLLLTSTVATFIMKTLLEINKHTFSTRANKSGM